MNIVPKKISNSFSIIITIIVVIFSLGWFYWSDIKVLVFGNEYQQIATPISGSVIDQDLKQKVILKLGQLKQYGEWPIIINAENPNRGNPFTPKQ